MARDAACFHVLDLDPYATQGLARRTSARRPIPSQTQRPSTEFVYVSLDDNKVKKTYFAYTAIIFPMLMAGGGF
jgi:hypothetical protein